MLSTHHHPHSFTHPRTLRDLVFIFCAAYGTQLHLGRYTLILGSILEGLFGSWAAFNGVTNSYISDCSRPGSKYDSFSMRPVYVLILFSFPGQRRLLFFKVYSIWGSPWVRPWALPYSGTPAYQLWDFSTLPSLPMFSISSIFPCSSPNPFLRRHGLSTQFVHLLEQLDLLPRCNHLYGGDAPQGSLISCAP